MAFSKTKAFSSTFFRTFIFTGFFDILAIVALEWTRADYLLGFGHQFELGTRLMMAFTGTNFLIHVFGEVLMTLNRYTAACKPMIHQKLWEKVRMKYLYFASVVLSFVAYTEWFLTKCVYEHTVDGWKLIGREEQTLLLKLISNPFSKSAKLLSLTSYVHIWCSSENAEPVNLILLTAITCPVNLMQSLYDLSVAFNLRNPVVLWIQSQSLQMQLRWGFQTRCISRHIIFARELVEA
ncbi:hypothetical protein Y032_0019g3757 [Ancylostoma ceylanicum]|uniref:Uncharacterized protein n=1 Tax=Ancylostoma ceylanicum TaxID=53326 RepID=A0A016V250_9BILA|nr:hypothetical protein Y032_0019g3757 [Ancylostoma ceylanicum]